MSIRNYQKVLLPLYYPGLEQSKSEIRNSGNINIFKRKIKILLEKVPFYFGWGDRKLNIIHSRLRNMCSSLNADLHLVNLKPSPACICGHGFEVCIHFFLECSFYTENRAILLNKLKNYVVTIELILAGDENLTPYQNIEIFFCCLFFY